MTAILKVDTIQDTAGNNIINESSDTITIGAAGDTVNVPGTEVKTNKVSPTSGTALQIGDSGDTITIPSGATIANSGTATGFGGAMTPLVEAQRKSSNQTISATTYTKIVFNTENIDTGSIYNNSTGVVTIADAGKYFVGVNVNVRELAGAAEYAAIQINNSARNISDVTGALVSGHGNGGYNYFQLNCQHIKSYSANDTIAIWIYGTEEVVVSEPTSNLTIFKIIE